MAVSRLGNWAISYDQTRFHEIWVKDEFQMDVLYFTAPGPWFSIKMTSYQYGKSRCGDKTILRPSYLHNGISCTGMMSTLYWISHQTGLIEKICSPRYLPHIPLIISMLIQDWGVSILPSWIENGHDALMCWIYYGKIKIYFYFLIISWL